MLLPNVLSVRLSGRINFKMFAVTKNSFYGDRQCRRIQIR